MDIEGYIECNMLDILDMLNCRNDRVMLVGDSPDWPVKLLAVDDGDFIWNATVAFSSLGVTKYMFLSRSRGMVLIGYVDAEQRGLRVFNLVYKGSKILRLARSLIPDMSSVKYDNRAFTLLEDYKRVPKDIAFNTKMHYERVFESARRLSSVINLFSVSN